MPITTIRVAIADSGDPRELAEERARIYRLLADFPTSAAG